MLKVLEQKITTLVDLVRTLKEQNSQLAAERDALQQESGRLKEAVTCAADENSQLRARLHVLEGTMERGSEKLEELSFERQRAKLALEDLISSIDSLVEREVQS